MARKRNSLAFPDKADPQGRRAIIRSRDEIVADEEILASQTSGDTELRNPGKPDRSAFQKVTYRISPDAADAIYEARRALRRDHHIRASLEEIAEAAILAAYQDLSENKDDSSLVNRLSRTPESQKSG
jgi:hypothetical protein